MSECHDDSLHGHLRFSGLQNTGPLPRGRAHSPGLALAATPTVTHEQPPEPLRLSPHVKRHGARKQHRVPPAHRPRHSDFSTRLSWIKMGLRWRAVWPITQVAPRQQDRAGVWVCGGPRPVCFPRGRAGAHRCPRALGHGSGPAAAAADGVRRTEMPEPAQPVPPPNHVIGSAAQKASMRSPGSLNLGTTTSTRAAPCW